MLARPVNIMQAEARQAHADQLQAMEERLAAQTKQLLQVCIYGIRYLVLHTPVSGAWTDSSVTMYSKPDHLYLFPGQQLP